MSAQVVFYIVGHITHVHVRDTRSISHTHMRVPVDLRLILAWGGHRSLGKNEDEPLSQNASITLPGNLRIVWVLLSWHRVVWPLHQP